MAYGLRYYYDEEAVRNHECARNIYLRACNACFSYYAQRNF